MTGEVFDPARLRRGRLERLRAELVRQDLAACVLVDPVNIRYATGARNMELFHRRNPSRYLFLPAEGPVVLFEYPGCHHLAADLETIDEIRRGTAVSFAA
jgi:Xaa-Pro dipeptidase